MYQVLTLNYEHDGIAIRDISDWETMTPKQVVDEFEGCEEIEMFLRQTGLEGTRIPRGQFREFAEWLCVNLPQEVRKV